ncbi:MAG: hypothetical protein HRF46_14315 [Acidobacteriota bacterium]
MSPSRPMFLALVAVAATGLAQTPTRHFYLDTPRALAGSLSSGVAISPEGVLHPLPPLTRTAELEEPLGLALAVAKDGTAYVGTGRPARVYRVQGGTSTQLADLEADQVTALLLAPGGDLWATTAVPALLVRIPAAGGTAQVVSRLAEGNLWDLAWFDGTLVAAAGNPGRLLRLGRGGLELAATVPDRHARCLAVAGSWLWIGTSGKGLVLRWNGKDPLGMVYDSPFTEITALATAPDGTVYAAGLTGDPTMGVSSPGQGTDVTVSSGDTPPPPKADGGGTATSEIVRIHPSGAATPIHRFGKQLAATLAWVGDGLLVGTGLEGELWQVVEGSPARLDTLDAAQVVRLAAGGEAILTQGPVALWRRSGSPRGTFTSPVQDAGQPARWGEVTARGSAPCTIRFRSGNSASPDDTWSDWTTSQPCLAARATAPPGRYLQWQVELGPAGVVEFLRVAYRQFNLPPQIDEITVHDPAEVFLKGPPPSDRAVSVTHPTRAGIFTTLDSDANDVSARLGKKYYLVGYQTVSWKASDPNNDPLLFEVEVQRAGQELFWPVASRLESPSVSIDAQALADGSYRFRITASDGQANPDAPATARALSRWFVVDNTPPRIDIARRGEAWVITVEDASSPLTLVEYNRDGERWVPLTPEDGLLDGRRETFRLPAVKGPRLLAVRAVDAHHNRATVAVDETP